MRRHSSPIAASQRDAPRTVAPELPPLEGPGGGGYRQAKTVPAVPGEPDLAISMRLDAYAPRAARHYVAGVDRPSPDLRDAVMLLTTELVMRALRHRQFTSREAIELRVWMPAEIVRVELRGPRNMLPPPGAPAGLGHGLLIEELADRSSIDIHAHHACAWFEIDRHELPATR
jgi:hypothetical protein